MEYRKVLLDTNILIDFLRSQRSSRPRGDQDAFNQEQAVNLIYNCITRETELNISCHTLKELLQRPNISEQEEERINSGILEICKVLVTDEKVARVAGYLARKSQEYREHHVEDCYIAATAIRYELPLLTCNPSDYRYVPYARLQVHVPYQYGTGALDK